jgi:hypothetical protein
VRRTFWRATLRNARAWATDVADHPLLKVLTLLAVFGVPTGIAAPLGLGWWASAVGVGMTALVALCEGAYRTWHIPATELAGRKAIEDVDRSIARACFEWIEQVQLLLDSREAEGPPPYSEGLSDLVTKPPEPAGPRERREQYQRQTVALYIERHRERGLGLFDMLVRLDVLVPDARETVRNPRSLYQVRDAMGLVEAGAERL